MPANRDTGGAKGASQTGTTASNSATGSERVLDGITVVGCSVEGAVAVPQTAGTDSLDGTRSEGSNAIEFLFGKLQ